MLTRADRSAFPNGSTFGKLLDVRRWSLVVIPLNVFPPFAGRDNMDTPRRAHSDPRVSPDEEPRSFPVRWHRPAIFFLAPSIEGGHYRDFFFVVRTAFGELMPHSDPPNIKH